MSGMASPPGSSESGPDSGLPGRCVDSISDGVADMTFSALHKEVAVRLGREIQPALNLIRVKDELVLFENVSIEEFFVAAAGLDHGVSVMHLRDGNIVLNVVNYSDEDMMVHEQLRHHFMLMFRRSLPFDNFFMFRSARVQTGERTLLSPTLSFEPCRRSPGPRSNPNRELVRSSLVFEMIEPDESTIDVDKKLFLSMDEQDENISPVMIFLGLIISLNPETKPFPPLECTLVYQERAVQGYPARSFRLRIGLSANDTDFPDSMDDFPSWSNVDLPRHLLLEGVSAKALEEIHTQSFSINVKDIRSAILECFEILPKTYVLELFTGSK